MSGIHLAFLVETGKVKEHAQWRAPEKKARWEVTHVSPGKGVNVAISPWAAEERRRVSGQELMGEEEKLNGGLASATQGRKLSAWKKFKEFKLVEEGTSFTSAVETCWEPI